MKFRILILLLLTALLASACSKNNSPKKWVYFSDDNDNKLYYTLDRIDETDSGIVKIWVKNVFGKKKRVLDIDAVYEKNMFMINCSNNSYKMNIGYYYSSSDEIIERTPSTQPAATPVIINKTDREFVFKPISTAKAVYFPILPNSSVSKLKEIACKQFKN